MLLNKEDFDKVTGEIYKITNTQTDKCYIGQTRSHRLNHNKYRPFGYMGRFRDHINEAYSNKKKQSWYLNSSILKYGQDVFKCELLKTCSVSELDTYEQQFISEYDSKYPNGYNLTDGGKVFTTMKDVDFEKTAPPPRGEKNLKRSDHTKKLISERLKSALNDEDRRKQMMNAVQKQHLDKKFARYINTSIDESKIEDYLSIIHMNKTDTDYVRVCINKIRTSFVGKYETIEETMNRARSFIVDLIKWQRGQIAGNPLEPSLPLTAGNICEELG